MKSLKDSSGVGNNNKTYYTDTSFTYKKDTFSRKSKSGFAWYKWLVLIAGLWFLFYPKPYILLFTILLVIPLITVLVNGFKNSSFMTWYRLEEKADGKYAYDIGNVFNFVTWFVAFRVWTDFYFEDKALFFYPAGIILIMFILYCALPIESGSRRFRSRRVWKPKFWLSLMLLLNAALYFFTVVYGVNCLFDDSKPVVYNVKVADTYVRSGKGGRSYYLDLRPWGNFTKVNRMRVKKDLYYEIKAGDTIQVNYQKGLLNIPWYYIPRNTRYEVGISL